jgi:hypothetical protein
MIKIALIKEKPGRTTPLQEEIICKEDLLNQIRSINSKFRRQMTLDTQIFRQTDNQKNEARKNNNGKKTPYAYTQKKRSSKLRTVKSILL